MKYKKIVFSKKIKSLSIKKVVSLIGSDPFLLIMQRHIDKKNALDELDSVMLDSGELYVLYQKLKEIYKD